MNFLQKIATKSPQLQSIFKGGIGPLLAKGGSIAIVYLFYVVLSRTLGAKAVGEFSIFFTLLSVTSVIAKLGLDTAIVKSVSSALSTQNWSRIKSTYLSSIILITTASIILSGLIFFFRTELSYHFLDRNDSLFFTLLAGLILVYSLFTFNTETLRGLHKMNIYAVFQNISVFSITLILFYFVFNDSPNLAFAFALLTLLILSFISVINSFSTSNSIELTFKPLLKEAFPMLLSNSAFFIMTWADVLMIGYFLSEDQTGIYSNASKIANLNIIFLFAINAIAAPKLAQYKAENNLNSIKIFTKYTSKLSLMFSIPITVIILLFSKELLSIFGDEFIIGSTVLLTLTLSQLINAACGSVINVLNMAGDQIAARNIIIFAAVINLVLNYFLISYIGIEGAAIATTISTLVWNGLAVLYIYKKYNFLSITLPWQKI